MPSSIPIRHASQFVTCSRRFGWTPEILSLVLSVGLGIAIVVLLWWYDEKPQPDLPLSMTLNAILQFLVSFTQFAFTMPAGKVLSQLKWLWFSGNFRPLANFQAYDDACRGGWGSFRLLWRMEGPGLWRRVITQLAAIVMMTAVLTAPITQQVLFYQAVLQPTTNGTATVLRSTTLSRTVIGNIKPKYDDLYSVRYAVIGAAYLGPLRTVAHIDPVCSSGDCNWDTYGSLSVCSKTVSVSDPVLVEKLRQVTLATFATLYNTSTTLNATLPDLPLYHTLILPFSQPSGQFGEEIKKTALGEFFFGFSDGLKIKSGEFNATSFQYMAFVLYYCTKTFKTVVAGGLSSTLEENSISVVTSSTVQSLNLVWNPAMKGFVATDSFCPAEVLAQSITLQSPMKPSTDNDTYTIDACTGIGTSSVVLGAATGMTILNDKLQGYLIQGELPLPMSIALYGDNGQNQVSDPTVRLQNIGKMVDNIAISLTNLLRETGPTQVGSNGTVNGTIFTPQLMVKVRWEWMTFLACQILLTAIVLAWIIKVTKESGIPKLKDSSIATMCALDPVTRNSLGSVYELDVNSKTIGKFTVQLNRADSPASVVWLAGMAPNLGRDAFGLPGSDVDPDDAEKATWRERIIGVRD